MGVPDCSRVVHVEDEKLCLFFVLRCNVYYLEKPDVPHIC